MSAGRRAVCGHQRGSYKGAERESCMGVDLGRDTESAVKTSSKAAVRGISAYPLPPGVRVGSGEAEGGS